MKIINILFGLALIFLFIAGKEHKKFKPSSSGIARGQMPALAKDKSGKFHLVYGSGDSLMYTYSMDQGTSFVKPSLLGILPHLVAGHTRGPQIAASDHLITVIACNKSGDIFSYQKQPSGGWETAALVNDADTVAKEGLMALAADGNITYAVWLDVRDNHNKLFGSLSVDGGKTWSRNILIYASPDTTVCNCCKPSVGVQGNHVFVMFHYWLGGNRDLYLIESWDAGKSFGREQKLGNGSWALNACPMDGGGIAIDKKGNLTTVWRREDKYFPVSLEIRRRS
ncbi:MAG: sialidase family protein [Saprospiraceae bacterium]|nr:sialidase family protein [Saprospiraceae bacterium]